MNDKSQLIKIVGGIGLFLAMIFALFKYKGPQVDKTYPQSTTTETVDSVDEKQVDMQEIYDAKVQALQDSIIMLQFQLHDYESKIENTNKKANEKVNTIVSTDAQQLVKFLSDRYKDSIR